MNNLKAFCQKHISLKDSLNSEEATKHSLIAPFLKLLGYDSTNPDEVIPELPATYGINKRSEKVDYAILINKVPVILIECKSVGSNLSFVNEQLFRYFNSVPTAKIGIVTDGIKYLFYSDTEALNRMDKDYYFEIDLETELTEEQLFELNRYCKSNFNLDSIHESAKRLKLKLDLKDKISNELLEPSDNFINFFINQSEYSDIREIFESSLFESIKEVYQIIGNSGNKIITTQEELEGFIIVKSLLRNYIDYKRITYKDTVNYFSVQIDGSSYKTICRLWLNGKIKYLGIIDENKSETKYPISSIDNIFEYSELIINSAKRLGG